MMRSRLTKLVTGVSFSNQFLGLSSEAIMPTSWTRLGWARLGLNSGSLSSFSRVMTSAASSRDCRI